MLYSPNNADSANIENTFNRGNNSFNCQEKLPTSRKPFSTYVAIIVSNSF